METLLSGVRTEEETKTSAGNLPWEQNRRNNFLAEQIAPCLPGFPFRRGKQKKSHLARELRRNGSLQWETPLGGKAELSCNGSFQRGARLSPL